MRDSEHIGNLLLRFLFPASEPEAKLYYLPFSFRKTGYRLGDNLFVLLVLQLFAHSLIVAENIREEQLVSVPIGAQRLVKGKLRLDISALAYIHEYLVFYATRGICRELDILVGAECVCRLYQSYRAYGNQILKPDSRIFKFLCYVDHKAQIPLHKLAAVFSVFIEKPQYFLLFLGRERWRKSFRRADIMRFSAKSQTQEKPREKHSYSVKKHEFTSFSCRATAEPCRCSRRNHSRRGRQKYILSSPRNPFRQPLYIPYPALRQPPPCSPLPWMRE